MKKRIYSIRKGHKTGVFYGYWFEIEKYVKGFSNPEFKGFDSIEEAEKYLNRGKKKTKPKTVNMMQNAIQDVKQKESKKQEHEKKKREKEKLSQKQQEITKRIIYSEEIEAHKRLPTVSIVLLGHQKTLLKGKPGYYEYILIHDQSGKNLKKKSDMISNTSPNRAIIIGLVDGLRQLKMPCHVKVYTKTSIGFKKMIKENNSPNADLLFQLKEFLLKKGHVIEEIVAIEEVENLIRIYK